MKPFIPTLIKYLKKDDQNDNNNNDDEENDDINGQKMIQKLIDEGSKEISPEFIENRQKGENDSPLSEIIRNDLIDDFIVYVNKTNISLSSELKPSKFETNQIILKNKQKLTLIEYSAFFGSIQIFNYLRMNGVEVTSNVIKYGIHSRNAELIMFFEENLSIQLKLESGFYLKESIKCHHNDFANYIKDNIYLEDNFTNEDVHAIIKYCIHYCNYDLFNYKNDKEIEIPINFINFFIQYDHIKLFKILYIKNNLKSSGNNDSLLKLAGQHGSHEIIQFLIEQPEFELKENLFEGCKKLTRIRLPSTIKKISKHSFSKCTSLIEVSFAKGMELEKIDDYAFFYCISLQKLPVIPCTCKVIGNRAFEGCSSLKDIQFDDIDFLETIGKYAFDGTLVKKSIKESKNAIRLITTEQDSDAINLPFFKRVNNESNDTYKVVLIGDTDTGKTSIIMNYLKDVLDHPIVIVPTVMANSYDYKEARIWDTSGQEIYQSLVPLYIRRSDAVIIVFNILDQHSLKSLNNWFEMAHKSGNPSCEIVLVKNKKDFGDIYMPVEDAETIASNEKASYFEVCSKTGSGVRELFSYLDTKIQIKTHFIEIK